MSAETAEVIGAHEGDVLAGKYRIERVLGSGGMGMVVAAHHLQLDERVAIKFLLPESLGNQEAVARFAREARAAVRIKSEHVARVTDVGMLETGAPYMVMEYLEGVDLGAFLERQGPLAIEQAIEFVLQACEAIAEAHGLGIVHRDLKPANLFCIRRADGLLAIKVLDFGISKVTSSLGAVSEDAAMTRTSAVIGSPLYMSPEQMQSARDVDGRTDIWALAVILFELLAGQPPFLGRTMPELCVSIITGPPAPLSALRPEVPAGLEAALFKALEKDRRKRYANVAEFAAALAPFGPERARASVDRTLRIVRNTGLPESGVLARPTPREVPAADVPRRGSRTVDSWGRTGRPTVGRRGAYLLGGAVAALAAATISLILFWLARASTHPAGPALGLASQGAQPPSGALPAIPLGSTPAPGRAPSGSEGASPDAVAPTASAESAETAPAGSMKGPATSAVHLLGGPSPTRPSRPPSPPAAGTIAPPVTTGAPTATTPLATPPVSLPPTDAVPLPKKNPLDIHLK